jgi:tungstate transport system substrate-binding protein
LFRKIAAVSFIIFQFFVLFPNERIILATTTSTYETGLLDHILKPFEKESGIKVHVISVGTGKALKLGEKGDADVILVHDEISEEKFVKNGYGLKRIPLMYNDFVVLGPQNDPAEIRNIKDIREVFKKIARTDTVFVSRQDNSGTHKKELSLWQLSGIDPRKTEKMKYIEAGQGMSAVQNIADQKNGYTLSDRSSFMTMKNKLRLEIVFEGDESLRNEYGLIAVNPYKHPHIKKENAALLINWLTSARCRKMIDEYKRNGVVLFKTIEQSKK